MIPAFAPLGIKPSTEPNEVRDRSQSLSNQRQNKIEISRSRSNSTPPPIASIVSSSFTTTKKKRRLSFKKKARVSTVIHQEERIWDDEIDNKAKASKIKKDSKKEARRKDAKKRHTRKLSKTKSDPTPRKKYIEPAEKKKRRRRSEKKRWWRSSKKLPKDSTAHQKLQSSPSQVSFKEPKSSNATASQISFKSSSSTSTGNFDVETTADRRKSRSLFTAALEASLSKRSLSQGT